MQKDFRVIFLHDLAGNLNVEEGGGESKLDLTA